MDSPVTVEERVAQAVEALQARRRVPHATYRVQMNENFTFRDTLALVPYLDALGISDLYLSPIFKARPGSTHGYDVCDYSELNPVLGTWEDFRALAAALRERDMGLLLDMVPNHMGIMSECNGWWMDVLENGPSSPYASTFDIDWRPVKRELQNRVLLPILEDQYGVVLEDGKLRVVREGGAFFVTYYAARMPLTPDSYPTLLASVADDLEAALGEGDEHLAELRSILTALRNLPPYTDTRPESIAERQREKEIAKQRLASLLEVSPPVQEALDAAIATLNGTPGQPESFDALDRLLSAQPYRLAFWRVAADEINYRRFFEVNELAAIRVEQPEVFDAVHGLLMEMVAEGLVTGLRIDHPDGLWDPGAYFRQLQESAVAATIRRQGGDIGDERELAAAIRAYFDAQIAGAEDRDDIWPLYVVAEKILSETEPLPASWALDGTTGYDFLSAANGLFVDGSAEERFTEIYSRFIRARLDFDRIAYNAKLFIMSTALSSELQAISNQLERITEDSRRYRDFTLSGLRSVIREVTASLPIYRTYISSPDGISERDQYFVLRAVVDARRRNPGTSRLLFSFLRDTLLLRNLDQFRPATRRRLLSFVMSWQQFTGPVMAKSVEDTTFYVYNRLVALNEVGSHPEQFGTPPDAFHEQNRMRVEHWPHAMLATSTHDTKRSEDVRARIAVLSEMPDEWEAALERWAALNASKKGTVDDEPAPDRNDEYLFYQTLLGVWPEGATAADETLRARLVDYMLKAVNEAKVHTSWINPDDAYMQAVEGFVGRVLDDAAFVEDFLPVQRRVAFFGRVNSLALTLLKLTVPGVPDIYRGTEMWQFSLVDPDNRRPVDYARRQAVLDEIRRRGDDRAGLAREFAGHSADGRAKLYVIDTALAFRKAHPALFRQGSYEPLAVRGEAAEHAVGFARRANGEEMIVVVPRLAARLAGGRERAPVGEVWGSTALVLPAGGGHYRNIFTGETLDAGDRLRLADVLCEFPVALLVRE
ncbi:MAG TPA: malto-oligosyltrehalose synthase [Aggregatilineales bacterium]|nr:malto-oligosyltrehalose synthase [Chloroflexota bacterium]HPV05854.1 malto-oligosyltrehalose synthase [Aggregatilineales bacterium]HQA67699.1 malto-oligosyltrehalose synthase [Aggregatilineales bacterium]